ncbi:MAG: ATP-binding protein [Chitinophagales bacterium]|nr:ATP-binding protein [Chitinophagales bacterium]
MELDFLSSQYSLYHLEHFFCYLMEDVAVSAELRHKIRLCFQEAVTNAVVHGNKSDESKYVHISLSLLENRLVFRIKDEGQGFDLMQIECPLQDKNLTQPRGRGLFLINEYADTYSYVNEEKTLVMEFSLL